MEEDRELVRRAKGGDHSAFDLLVVRHHRSVINLIYRMTGDYQNSEDLAQDVFLRAYRGLSRFEERCAFFTWLYRITLSICMDHRKGFFRRRNVSLDEAPETEFRLPQAESAEDGFQRKDLAEAVRSAVVSLPEDQRAPLVLCRYFDLSYEQAAEILKISLPALKSRIHRARQVLREKLEPFLEGGVL